jgi:hypothetical protein
MRAQPYREPAELSPKVTAAAECLKQAKVLIDEYLKLACRLGKKNLLSGTRYDPRLVDLDERLRDMDANHVGLWEKLDEARELLQCLGYKVDAYDALRARVESPHAGHHEHHSTEQGIFEARHESRWWVDEEQLALPPAAYDTLAVELPPDSLVFVPDVEAERSMRRSDRRNHLRRAAYLAFAVALFFILIRICRP